MAGEQGRGGADAASRAGAAAGQSWNAAGISDDADAYQDLVEEGAAEDVLDLDSRWLYQRGNEVFGPVSAKTLVEKLYEGELEAETRIAPEDGDFLALRRYGAFRVHLPKAAEHRAAAEDARRTERAAKARVLRRRIMYSGAGLLVSVAIFFGVWFVVTDQRAERLRDEQEKSLQADLARLQASVTIEPPLIDLKESDDDPEPSATKGRAKGRKTKVVALSGGTEKLSREEIMVGVSSAFSGIKKCIVQQMQRERESVPERVMLSFNIGNDGVVREVSFDDRFLRKSPMRDCVAQQLAAVRFRAFKGEVRNVEYPITIGKPS